jgi:hypothetical protein
MMKGGIRRARALGFCAGIARGGCSGVRFVEGIVVTDFPASAGSIIEEARVLRAFVDILQKCQERVVPEWLLEVLVSLYSHFRCDESDDSCNAHRTYPLISLLRTSTNFFISSISAPSAGALI